MSAFLARLARLLTRRWGRGLIGTVAVLAVLIGVSAASGPAADDFSIPNTDSQEVVDLLEAHSPLQAGADSQVVFTAKSGTLNDPQNKAAVEAAVAKLAALDDVVAAPSPFAGGAQSQNISPDGTVGLTTVMYDIKPAEVKRDDGIKLLDAAEAASTPEVAVNVRGTMADIAAESEIPIGELAGIVVAGFLLFFLFRSAAAMLVTLLAAVIGVILAQALLAAVAQPLGLPSFAAFLAALLGLGAGIDYALLVIGRFREQRAAGYSVGDSAAKAAATAGSAVVTAGLIVMVAIAGLLAIGIPFIGKMGLGAAVGVFAVVISAITVLPMLIGAFAKRLKPKKAEHVAASPAFSRWGEIVTARPIVSVVAGVLILLVFAIPALDMRIGQPDDGNKPEGNTARLAYDSLNKGFGPGSNGPLLIAVDLPKGDPGNEAALANLQAKVAATPGVLAAVPPRVSEDGEIATLVAIPKTSPQDEATSELLTTLRDDVVPAATQGTQLRAFIGGQTAALEDLSAKTASGLPVFIAVVIGLSVILLMAAFRSLWIPLVSAVFNLLSVA
ncbi:MAG: MMPL family transporter, partial [Solirubrobacteraceae bacterium]|nr:MMPL family transporter [Solirubrobacteraceae bacterium]